MCMYAVLVRLGLVAHAIKIALIRRKTLKFSSRGSAPHPAGVGTPDPAKRLNQHEHLPLTLTLADVGATGTAV